MFELYGSRYVDPEEMTPADLGMLQAERVMDFPEFSFTEQEGELVDNLSGMARAAGLLGDWYVQASYGFAAPLLDLDHVGWQGERFNDGVSFHGSFCHYSIFKIANSLELVGSLQPRSKYSALCLVFDQGFFIDSMTPLDDGDLLHVPVVSINAMDC